jgi:hypothetical protein
MLLFSVLKLELVRQDVLRTVLEVEENKVWGGSGKLVDVSPNNIYVLNDLSYSAAGDQCV